MRVDAGETAPPAPAAPAVEQKRRKGAIGAAVSFVGLLLFKLKSVIFAVFAFGKPLLFGLTKMSTLLSMGLTVGLYASLFGAKFALGLVLAILRARARTRGHPAQVRHRGHRPDVHPRVRRHRAAPPGAGVADRARIGLAGPRWGLAASLVAAMLGFVLHAPVLLAVARVSAWINLFNLLPFGSLDGGRGFRAMSRPGRWLACLALLVTWLATKDGLVLLISGVVVRT